MGPFYQYVQRQGERPEEYHFKAFLSTTDRDEVEMLTEHFPKRWHVEEEFFNAHQALGWDRAGTCNLNIRYGQMTMALIAEAAINQLQKDWRCLKRVGMRSTWPRLTFRTGRRRVPRHQHNHHDVLQCSRRRQAAGH